MKLKKKLIIALSTLALLIVVGVPGGLAFARSQAISPTTFYACEDSTTGQVNNLSITQDTTTANATGYCLDSETLVQWDVQGLPGTNGTDGTNGIDGQPGAQGSPGPKGDTGPSGLPFTQAACTETLTGSAQQENLIFCLSGVESDGGTVYTAAIAAASHRIIVGTPLSSNASVDWNGAAITYVEFTSGLHAEYHADNVVRFYNVANQRVF